MMDIEQVNMEYSILQMWTSVHQILIIVHRIVTTLLDPIPVLVMEDTPQQIMEWHVMVYLAHILKIILKIILHSTIHLHLIIDINNSRFYSNSFLFYALMMDIEQVNMEYSILQMWMNVQQTLTIVHRIVTTLLDPIPVLVMEDIPQQIMEWHVMVYLTHILKIILKIILHSTINLHLIININNSRFYSNSFLFNALMMDIEQVNMEYSILQIWMNVHQTLTIVHRSVTTLMDPIPVLVMEDIPQQIMD